MIKLNGYTITPTIFPDKTSQVWKLPIHYYGGTFNTITWEFEHEAEFIWVAQLQELLLKQNCSTLLELPYLPYARQDKDVNDSATFALHTFARMLNSLSFNKIRVFDPHNVETTQKLINNIIIDMPDLMPLLVELNAAPIYPDEGARIRYKANYKFITGYKDRDPLTGEIKGIKLTGTVEPRTYLIVDDICDGGRTFIEVAKKLYEAGAKEVHLYVSHGIFSKGLQVLRDAGIKRIFTRNGEVK